MKCFTITLIRLVLFLLLTSYCSCHRFLVSGRLLKVKGTTYYDISRRLLYHLIISCIYVFWYIVGLVSQLSPFQATTTTTTASSTATSDSFPSPNYSPEKQRSRSRRFGLRNLSMLPTSKARGEIFLSKDETTAQIQWKTQVEEHDRYAQWLETFGSIL